MARLGGPCGLDAATRVRIARSRVALEDANPGSFEVCSEVRQSHQPPCGASCMASGFQLAANPAPDFLGLPAEVLASCRPAASKQLGRQALAPVVHRRPAAPQLDVGLRQPLDLGLRQKPNVGPRQCYAQVRREHPVDQP